MEFPRLEKGGAGWSDRKVRALRKIVRWHNIAMRHRGYTEYVDNYIRVREELQPDRLAGESEEKIDRTLELFSKEALMRVAVMALAIVLMVATIGCAAVSLSPDHVFEWDGTAADSLGNDYPEGVGVIYTIERKIGAGGYEDFLTDIIHIGAGEVHSVSLTADSHLPLWYRLKTILSVGGETVEQDILDRCESGMFWWLGLYGGPCEVRKQ